MRSGLPERPRHDSRKHSVTSVACSPLIGACFDHVDAGRFQSGKRVTPGFATPPTVVVRRPHRALAERSTKSTSGRAGAPARRKRCRPRSSWSKLPAHGWCQAPATRPHRPHSELRCTPRPHDAHDLVIRVERDKDRRIAVLLMGVGRLKASRGHPSMTPPLKRALTSQTSALLEETPRTL